MAELEAGRLADSSNAPRSGELTEQVARLGDVDIQLILSGSMSEAIDFNQEDEEWVVLLDGAALLESNGSRYELGAGDWLRIPPHCPHRLVHVEANSRWLALHRRNTET